MRLFVSTFMCLTIASFTNAAGPNLDSCDWFGSGTLEMALSRGVQPVYLRCNQGTVRWHYPQGALRTVLQYRTPGSPFEACIKRSKGSSGARIYLAGQKRLHLIFKPEDPTDLVRCVASERDEVALYVEADPIADVFRKSTTEFSYHLKKRTKKLLKGQVDECKPCSEEQLLRQYCSSDFVIQGSVASLFHNKLLSTTEVTVRVTSLHATTNIEKFTKLKDSGDQPKYVILQRPLKCGTKSGSGEYLFLGKWILGNPSLNCVPRISEWKKVRRKAMAAGTNECILNL